MEKYWGRRHKFVAAEEKVLTSLLQPAFPGRKVVSAELLTEGHCNTNYKIRVSDFNDAFVLRIYVRNNEALQKDWDIFNLIHENVPIPELLYADLHNTHYDKPYAIMKWVDGPLLSKVMETGSTDDIVACAYDLGAVLAGIGTYTFSQTGFFGPGLTIAESLGDGSASYLSGIEQYLQLDRVRQRLGEEDTNQLEQFVSDNAEYLTELNSAPALVHADFKGINILMQQRAQCWKVAAVLDWEFAFAGTPLFDIGNMLRYENLYPPAFEAEFVRGFLDHGGVLPPNWKKIIKLLDLLNLCEFLNAETPEPAMIEEVKGLITSTLEQWKASSTH
jgi:aminoglycoside phosphotransferase (APT) family kinase protein